MVEAFENLGSEGDKRPPHGSAVAWLAHLNLLRFAIQRDYDTALIIEDDVDWDLRLRDQTPLIANAIRNFTNAGDPEHAPYGRSWDLLWLGHCGEIYDESTARVTFADPTVVPHELYRGWSRRHVAKMSEGQRSVSKAVNPVCECSSAPHLFHHRLSIVGMMSSKAACALTLQAY